MLPYAILIPALLLYSLMLPGSSGAVQGWGVYSGVAAGLLTVLMAPPVSRLHPALRHMYLAHYAAVGGLIAPALILPMTTLYEGNSQAGQLAALSSVLAALWVASHLAGCASEKHHRMIVWSLGAAGAAAVMITPLPGRALLAITLLIAVAWLLENPLPEPENKSRWNVFGFVNMNAAILAGFAPLFAAWYLFIFHWAEGDTPLIAEALTESIGDMPAWAVLIIRWSLAVGFTVLCAAAVFLWPARPASHASALGGFAALLGACAAAGQTTVGDAVRAAIPALALLIFATRSLAFVSGRKRWRMAFLAAAATATISVQLLHVPVDPPIYAVIPWVVEVIGLGGLWLGAYFFAIDWLRKVDFQTVA